MEAQDREAGVRQQLADLGQQLSTLQDEEQRLTADSQRLQAKVDAFRVRKETIKASYTAAEASLAISAAFADIGGHANGQEPSDVEAAKPPASGGAPPATAAPPAPAGGFLSYDAESFLDEFFPGAEKTEVDIEAAARAEPGAAEVRTLAAYVRALGGTLEIIADIGGERIVLR